MFKKWELQTFILLTDYLHYLWKWEEIADFENDLFVEALQEKEKVQYFIDIFIEGTTEDKIWFYKHEKKVVKKIESRIKFFREINR